jgi:hypothetical protein
MQQRIFQYCEPAVVARWMSEAHRIGGRPALRQVIDASARTFGHETTKRALLIVFREDDFSLLPQGAP